MINAAFTYGLQNLKKKIIEKNIYFKKDSSF